jgi:GTP-binding protein
VAVLMIDGMEGITAQDAHIAGYIHDAAKGIILVINKWDLVRERRRATLELADPDRPVSLVPGATPAPSVPVSDQDLLDPDHYTQKVRSDLKFLPYAPVIFAAAKTRYHVGSIMDQALRIYEIRHMRISTSQLNDLVRDAVNRHHPTFIQGRQLRIYYATQADINPPTFVFFVNEPELAHFGYQRYLENRLRDVFGFPGTTIRMQFRPRSKDEDLDERRREQRQSAASGGRKKPARPPSKARHS